MPTTKSAKKALKVSQKNRSRNRRFFELYKESVKALDGLLAAEKKDEKALNEGLSLVYSRIDTLEKKNIFHKNNVARKKSTLAKKIAHLVR